MPDAMLTPARIGRRSARATGCAPAFHPLRSWISPPSSEPGSMVKLPDPPEPAWLSAHVAPELRPLPASSRLWRIYFRAGPHPTLWNSFRHWGPTAARFDHHLADAGGQGCLQARGVLYAAGGSRRRPDLPGRGLPALAADRSPPATSPGSSPSPRAVTWHCSISPACGRRGPAPRRPWPAARGRAPAPGRGRSMPPIRRSTACSIRPRWPAHPRYRQRRRSCSTSALPGHAAAAVAAPGAGRSGACHRPEQRRPGPRLSLAVKAAIIFASGPAAARRPRPGGPRRRR